MTGEEWQVIETIRNILDQQAAWVRQIAEQVNGLALRVQQLEGGPE